ncbi:OLC1v1008702C1 [Oldenlandia corymbosa var. corymbosa]|uniref:OLC1v1008702C1 n=1 Tax=Oldenlandia corymbosa var. corymbosa TaxID=529605 RepID=A0AAV1DM51_OLDCO|nr:OLC1v1008702C1 [Oldenlandia corymbosa var. corymbosa]
MARNISYMLNLFHTSKYMIENGSINTFSNMPDHGLFVEERLSYEGLISKICMTLGWDPAHLKLHPSFIFDSPGGRRGVKIKNDSHVEFMNRIDPMSCLDLYIDLEDITHEKREASLENNVSFGGFPRGECAGTSRIRDEEETPLFAQDDYRKELDPDYIALSESEEDCDVSGESDFEESDEEREPHESGRVLRQFGYIQDVPKRPMIKDNAAFLLDHAHNMSGYPSNNWVDHHSAVHRHWNRRKEYVLRDLEEGDPGFVYEGYYEWFMVNTVRLISNPKNYEPKGYKTSSSRVKSYGEVLNNIRVSSEKFREKREDENLLVEELDKHLNDIINQTHVALTLGANDEMDVEDTQILIDEEPSLPSQPPPGKKAKPWSRDKIGG